jgi:hypothetical protein
MRNKDYVAYKKKNENVDSFGLDARPHFEIDFVVR